MARNINAMFVNGCACCGKATFIKLLASALLHENHTNGSVESVDMGSVINWAKDSKSPLGKQLRTEGSVGLPVSDKQAVESFYLWYNDEIRRNPNLQILLISDAPRNERQFGLLKPFNRSLVIHLRTDHNLAQMIAKGQNISDTDFHRYWLQYIQNTVPSIDKITKGRACRLDRSSSFKDGVSTYTLDRSLPLEMVEKTLLHLSTKETDLVHPHIVHKALVNLRDHNHPIHRKIKEIIRATQPVQPAQSEQFVTA